MRSVMDHTVPLIFPKPGMGWEGMYEASIPKHTPCVMAMCTPTHSAPRIIPAHTDGGQDVLARTPAVGG